MAIRQKIIVFLVFSFCAVNLYTMHAGGTGKEKEETKAIMRRARSIGDYDCFNPKVFVQAAELESMRLIEGFCRKYNTANHPICIRTETTRDIGAIGFGDGIPFYTAVHKDSGLINTLFHYPSFLTLR